MLIALSVPWTVAADVAAWLVIHLAVAYVGVALPSRLFDPAAWLFRTHTWEEGGGLYERVFRIRRWKDRLPDGAALMGAGFRKKRLGARDSAYFALFVRETCRAEAVHGIVILFAPLFFLWNPPWASAVMILYALAANVPCILAQRYNRLRLRRLLR